MVKLVEKVNCITLKPFPINVWVVTTNDISASGNHAYKHLGGEDRGPLEPNDHTGAFTVTKRDNGNIYVILPFDSDIDWIAHEVYHVVRHVAIFTGVDDGEFMAYYIGYLTKKLARWNYKATQSVDKKFWK